MKSFRAAASKKVPAGQPASARDLGQRTGLLIPFSMRSVIRRLDPETVIFASGPLGPSTVTGWGQLGILSDGSWSFRGHVREDGGVGHNYVLAIALGFKDPSGKIIAFAHEGSVSGTVAIGSRDSDWQEDGHNLLIADAWDDIKNSGFEARLHVSTDPLEVLETVLVGLIAGAVAAGVIIFGASPGVSCDWIPTSGAGGAGVDLRCTREY
jgi:hypothetical protein